MSTSQTKFEALKLTNERIRRLKSSHMTALLEAQKRQKALTDRFATERSRA